MDNIELVERVNIMRDDARSVEDLRHMSMWAKSGDNYKPCEIAVSSLPAGQYIVVETISNGLHFHKKDVNTDSLVILPDSNSEKVIESITRFWGREEKYREYGFLWKRGIIMYGPPGGGKTSTVQQIANMIVAEGGLAVYCVNPEITSEGLRLLRGVEPTRPIVVIMEDLDALIRNYGESVVLALLDGELQIDNVTYLATTNYPEKLDKRIINRPSRFDEVIHVGMPNAKCREVFILAKHKHMEPDSEELSKWVAATDGFSVAHIKEVIVSVECMGRDFDEVILRLRKMIDVPITGDGEVKVRTTVGFA